MQLSLREDVPHRERHNAVVTQRGCAHREWHNAVGTEVSGSLFHQMSVGQNSVTYS